ncbi:MAG: hypothetical protein Q9195_008116 [Heterodermia aff. obscurata]
MEEHGPEAKRPRLDTTYASSHRPHPSHQHSIAPSHSYSPHSLPPRNSYPSGAPTPSSQYYEPALDHDRALPHPSSAHPGYTPHSGHSTPVREQRQYAPDSNYTRRGSASAAKESPEGSYQQYSGGRPLSTADGHYHSSYASDSANHAVGYPNNDGTMNGHTHGLPMPTYPEATPGPSGRPPEYDHSPVSLAQSGYPGSAYGTPSSSYTMQQRMRKGNRATQACDVCRQRKAKADRANQAIMDTLAAQDRNIENLDRRMGNFETMVAPLPALQSSIDRIEKFLLNSGSPRVPLGAVALDGQERRPSFGLRVQKSESPNRRVTPDQKMISSSLSQTPITRDALVREPKVEASPSGSYTTASTEPISDPNCSNNTSNTVNVPVEHHTAAHRLLAWPAIKKLVDSQRTLKGLASDLEYVMRLEEDSGVLRVYGRGEGRSKRDYARTDTGQQSASSPAPSVSSGRSDESPDPSSPQGIWGSGFITPVTSPSMSHMPSEYPFDFSLNIHPATLRSLLDSYLNNMHILHPFLDKNGLTRMVKKFSMRYNPTEQKLSTSLFSTASNMSVEALRGISMNSSKGGKRNHYDGGCTNSFATEAGFAQSQPKQEVMFERSIATAIVLLVMALGRICEWKEPLPGVRHLNEARRFTNAGVLHSSPSNSNMQSPPSLSHGISPASSSSNALGTMTDPSNSLPSSKSTPEELKRNVDIIPGLSYYAPATDILGNLHGSNDLLHVQAYLLAGLYMGQLARTFESFNWIASACRACRFLVRDPSLGKESEPRKNQIKFAFWTCSQLESDILAELDLVRSGIQELREVQYPTGYVEPGEYSTWDCSETQIMAYYSGQIHIRNQLNDIQKDLYAPENIERATRGFRLRDALIENLDHWRKYVPPAIQWKDDDEPASNINAARLRAKYYGASYIIHRPFLRYALEHEIFSETASPGSMGPPHAMTHFERDQILKSCKTCVSAAIQSTIAFDRVMDKERLIVTNIFGTAHAQFGNILVLSATFKSRSLVLSRLITPEKLDRLFERTITFLRRLSPLSESLGRDAKILEALREVVFEVKASGSSFSSMDI